MDGSRSTRIDDVATTLNAAAHGDERAAAELLPLVYDELRERARQYMRAERPGQTLQPTAIVHEAFLRLIDPERVDWNGRTHFLAVAAKTLRRVLADHARARATQKRGGGAKPVSLAAVGVLPDVPPIDILALEEALQRLAAVWPRHADVVQLRFFGELTVEEVAKTLGISKETVKLDWRFARAWLHRELASEGE